MPLPYCQWASAELQLERGTRHRDMNAVRTVLSVLKSTLSASDIPWLMLDHPTRAFNVDKSAFVYNFEIAKSKAKLTAFLLAKTKRKRSRSEKHIVTKPVWIVSRMMRLIVTLVALWPVFLFICACPIQNVSTSTMWTHKATTHE
jgi:hypothetical protein